MASSVYAFCFTFFRQNFAAYDDEGMLMITIKRFFDGRALYDDILTIYGPLYYFYEWVGHALLRMPVSHESVRWISMFFWVVSALAVFVLVYRATGSLLLSAVAHYLAFQTLQLIGFEAAHPQELCILLVVGFGIAAWVISDTTLLALALGGMVGAMVVMKINLGVFGVIALALTFLFAAHPGGSHFRSWRSIFLPLAAGGAIAFPVLLMWAHSAEWWAQKFVLLTVVAIASAVITIWGRKLDRTIELRHFLAATLGLAVVAGAFVAFVVAHGSTIHGVVDLLIVQPRRAFGNAWFLPVSIPGPAVAFAVAGLVCAVAVRRGLVSGIALATGKALFAIAVGVLSLRGHTDTLMAFGPALFWLAAAPASDETESAKTTPGGFARTLLVLMSAVHILYAYPVAGDQVAFTTILTLALASICFMDALPALTARYRWVDAVAGAPAASLLLVSLLIAGYIFSAGLAVQDYRADEPVGLPGTDRIRIVKPYADTMRGIAAAIDSSPCTMLATAPGLLSLNFLTGKPAPRLIDYSTWMFSLSAERQRQTIDELAREPFPCVVYSPQIMRFWTRGAKLDSPLLRYMMENFQTVRKVGVYELMEPRGRIGR